MAKIVTKGAKIALEATGAWQWGAGKTLEIELSDADTLVTAGGAVAVLDTDVLDAIADGVKDESYHYLPAARPGTVKSADATVNPGTLTSKLTTGGEVLATSETTGTFIIQANQPSELDTPAGPVADPLKMYPGTWKILDPAQTVLSEDEGSVADLGLDAMAAQATPAGAEDDTADEAEPVDPNAFMIPLEITLSRGPEFDIWASVLLRDHTHITVEIAIAQPGGEGGLAGLFTRTARIGTVLMEDDADQVGPASEPLRIALGDAKLDPEKPVWIAVRALFTGRAASLNPHTIGLTSLFVPQGQKTVVVAPDLPSGSVKLHLDDDGKSFAKGAEVYGTDNRGRANAMIDALPHDRGWVPFEADPSAPETPGERDWDRVYEPQEIALSVKEVKPDPDKQETKHLCEPVAITLTPESPKLLALRAAATDIDDAQVALTEAFKARQAQAELALSVAGFMARDDGFWNSAFFGVLFRDEIANAVSGEIVDILEVPWCWHDMAERSGGLLRRSVVPLRDTLSAPELFLTTHSADLREKGLALAKACDALMKRLADPATFAEQAKAKRRLGAAAMTWGAPAKAGQAEARHIWLATIMRAIEPSAAVVAETTAVMAEIAALFDLVDKQTRRIVKTLPRLMRTDAPTLSTPALRKGISTAIVSGKALQDIADRAASGPTLQQAVEFSRTAKTAHNFTGAMADLAGKNGAPLRKLARGLKAGHRNGSKAFEMASPTALSLLYPVEQLSRVTTYVILDVHGGGIEEAGIVAQGLSRYRSPKLKAPDSEIIEFNDYRFEKETASSLFLPPEKRIVAPFGELSMPSVQTELPLPGQVITLERRVIETAQGLDRTDTITRTLSPDVPDMGSTAPNVIAHNTEFTVTGPDAPDPLRKTSFDKLGDSFVLVGAVFDLMHRFSDKHVRDMVENTLAVSSDSITILSLYTDYLGVQTMTQLRRFLPLFRDTANLGKMAATGAARLNLYATILDSGLSAWRIYRNYESSKDWEDYVGPVLGVIVGICAIGGIIAAAAAVGATTITAGVVLAVALPLMAASFGIAAMFAKIQPDGVRDCLEDLERLVAETSFAEGTFPKPDWRQQKQQGMASLGFPPSDLEREAELDWVVGIRDHGTPRAGDLKRRIDAAASMIQLDIRPVTLDFDAASPLLPGMTLRGTLLTVPISYFIAPVPPLTLHPTGYISRDRKTTHSAHTPHLHLSTTLVGQTLRIEAVPRGGPRGGIVTGLPLCGLSSDSRTGDLLIGAAFAMEKRGALVPARIDIPMIPPLAEGVKILIIHVDGESGDIDRRPTLHVDPCPGRLHRRREHYPSVKGCRVLAAPGGGIALRDT